MTLPRIYLIAILLLIFGVGSNAQEPPTAVLVDEFENVFCTEDFRARIDNQYFIDELKDRADLVRLIVD